MEEKENSTKSILLIIALIVIIILLGVIIYMLVNNKKTNNDIDNQSKTTTTTQKVSNEDDNIKNIIEKFLELDCNLHTDGILDYLNLGFDENKQTYDEATEMVITNVKYDYFKNAMLNYVTEEYFKKETDGYIVKDKSGYVRKSQGGGNCYISTINSIAKTGNLSYDVNITRTTDYNDESYTETEKFTFKEYNNKLVVDTYSGRE